MHETDPIALVGCPTLVRFPVLIQIGWLRTSECGRQNVLQPAPSRARYSLGSCPSVMIAREKRMDQQQLWVEPSGGIILARIRGVPSEPLLRACQERVLRLQDTGQCRVL